MGDHNYGANGNVFTFCSRVRKLRPPSTTVIHACVYSELNLRSGRRALQLGKMQGSAF